MIELTPPLAARMLDVIAQRQHSASRLWPRSVLEDALARPTNSKWWRLKKAPGSAALYDRPERKGRWV